jgi:hypothetical protein
VEFLRQISLPLGIKLDTLSQYASERYVSRVHENLTGSFALAADISAIVSTAGKLPSVHSLPILTIEPLPSCEPHI